MLTEETLSALSPAEAARRLEILAALQRWRAVAPGTSIERARAAIEAAVPLGIGPLALDAMAREISARHGTGDDLAREAAERAVTLRELLLADDETLVHALAYDTEATIAILESLRDGGPLAARVTTMFPQFASLAHADESQVSLDYEARESTKALLDHLSLRTLGRKLLGLERNDCTRFQVNGGLSNEGFEHLQRRAARAFDAGSTLEANYLDTMNAARSDKARLCDYVIPGTILEIGPGGGVVLDLLAERNPSSKIIGLDVSRAVVEALSSRKMRENRPWDVIEGDAFQLGKLFGDGTLDTVVFCSILHEIYSYVPWDDGDGRGVGRFRMGSVKAIVASAFRALKKGGRIVVRDGVMPPDGTNVIEFIAPDADETFMLYVREFEGRKITFERVGPRSVRLASKDAHAFLYTYVWGPASFPYEIREQYGVDTYERFANTLLAACESTGSASAKLVALPADVRSYLQPGYTQHLKDRVRLFEQDGITPARLFDSNALWVIEKQ